MTDPAVEMVSIMKSARVGYTRMIGNLIGYHIDHDPCPIMMVQPDLTMAEDYSKQEFDGMVRDTPVLGRLVAPEEGRKRKDTLLRKRFPGGSLRLVGANSPAGFRMVSIRVLLFDEVDGYPAEAGNEGDPIRLAIKRTETFWNRKIVAGSTPTADGNSHIKSRFEAGDQRRYFVPCPLCGHMHVLAFKNLKWPDDDPLAAYFQCPACEGHITHDKKTWMVENGEWRASKPFAGHASFHIWTAYSYSANASWGQIAADFLAASQQGPRFLKTFINTTLGETWQDATDVPDWNALYARREPYARGVVPKQARYVTAGVDVQKDRLEAEVVAWGPGLESWSLDYIVMEGDTGNIDGPAWKSLDELLARQFESESGIAFPISKMGIDAGYDTQTVINWCRRRAFGGGRIIPVKGVHNQPQIIRSPQSKDIRSSGKRKRNGARLWPVGVSHIKKELYGWFRLPVPTESNPIPDTGFCHFGEFLDEHHFKMLTAEILQRTFQKNGYSVEEWYLPSNRRNEMLDCRVYNRAMAYLCGVDNLMREPAALPASTTTTKEKPATLSSPAPVVSMAQPGSAVVGKRTRRRGSWLR
ncbi:MAG: phage terminase large subunit family protein [Planctomycetaceae bacterium]|nr:phage terminase large subunit family protein [Planctomycetaceae bacterium]